MYNVTLQEQGGFLKVGCCLLFFFFMNDDGFMTLTCVIHFNSITGFLWCNCSMFVHARWVTWCWWRRTRRSLVTWSCFPPVETMARVSSPLPAWTANPVTRWLRHKAVCITLHYITQSALGRGVKIASLLSLQENKALCRFVAFFFPPCSFLSTCTVLWAAFFLVHLKLSSLDGMCVCVLGMPIAHWCALLPTQRPIMQFRTPRPSIQRRRWTNCRPL